MYVFAQSLLFIAKYGIVTVISNNMSRIHVALSSIMINNGNYSIIFHNIFSIDFILKVPINAKVVKFL